MYTGIAQEAVNPLSPLYGGAPGETARDHVANALQVLLLAPMRMLSVSSATGEFDRVIEYVELDLATLQAIERRLRLALEDLDKRPLAPHPDPAQLELGDRSAR
jgi:hypothetical protein